MLRQSQSDSFAADLDALPKKQPLPKKSRIFKLSPVLTDSMLRLAGRIKNVQGTPQDVINPILLDGRHQAVRLFIRHYHKKFAHANTETVVNEIRQRYWIIGLRSALKSIANECYFCRIRRSLPQAPPTGDLPPERLAHHKRPFTHTGLDYFGPVTVTIGRRHEKRWVALYTCMTSRAVHLEIVNSLSTDSAILSLRRFIVRRGTPETMLSDNGTSFVGAARALREFFGTQIHDLYVN